MGEEAILLDVLFEANHYKNIQPQEIKSSFLITSAKLASVNMPSLEDLLGDKLTAFAPNWRITSKMGQVITFKMGHPITCILGHSITSKLGQFDGHKL